ncbi:MAG TPA: hypothetical protein VFE13_08530 [Caulobacteraceae bacterium]|nr:hypothetical protein [Caulobacteraceae bacterium]
MYLAALAALPIIQKLEQGLVDKVASLFSPSASSASGQNVPSQAAAGSANSAQPANAQPTAARPLSTGMNAALIALQQQHSRQIPVVGGYRAAGGQTNGASTPTASLKV